MGQIFILLIVFAVAAVVYLFWPPTLRYYRGKTPLFSKWKLVKMDKIQENNEYLYDLMMKMEVGYDSIVFPLSKEESPNYLDFLACKLVTYPLGEARIISGKSLFSSHLYDGIYEDYYLIRNPENEEDYWVLRYSRRPETPNKDKYLITRYDHLMVDQLIEDFKEREM
jgi:hypothetical protein